MDGIRRRARGDSPPILTLLDLLDRHRGAFEYDWQTRFQKSTDDLGRSMRWAQVWVLVGVLLADPASHLGAAVAGWSYPVDRATLVLMDLYDQHHQIAISQGGSKRKAKPYPRPWPSKTKSRTKPSADLTQDEIIAALRKAGHTAALPGVYQPPPPRPRDARGRFVKAS